MDDPMDGDQYPKYVEDEVLFETFVREHTILSSAVPDSNNDVEGLLEPGLNNVRRIPCYPSLLQRIKDRNYYHNSSNNSNPQKNNVFIVEVPLSELVDWDSVRGRDLATRINKNTVRYSELICNVLDKILNSMEVTSGEGEQSSRIIRDSIDVLHDQRLAQQAARIQENAETGDSSIPLDREEQNGNLMNDDVMRENGIIDEFPPILMRRYELRILPVERSGLFRPFIKQYRDKTRLPVDLEDQSFGPPTKKKSGSGASLRHIRSRSMGRLVTIRGMIVRASDVKPCCVVATYICDMCGSEVYQVVKGKREFLPQRICPTPVCQTGQKPDTLHMQTRGSKFVKFQELKLQELPSQVPMGHIPRSMSVHCQGELTRQACPGDVVTVDGIFLPQRVAESGFLAMKAGLISTTFLEAQNLILHKKSYNDSLSDELLEDEKAKLHGEIMDIATGEDPIGALSSSLAPEIFGHEDIKRALLLQLVGGCTRKLPDGMRIRGDINICLMGDPGVAKSQLLKHVASIAPRGVYTTGKGSSGVGLTAAITKDITTGEMALEGGALVLADQGICAIDEFDKMDESDRTAIHEVMEQQTVSIAKAGIVATLNARAAVLAAANPLYGRYNKKKSMSENINLPNSLLSRFDLMFLILDIADIDRDMSLARHVTFVHQNEGLGNKSRKKDKDKSLGVDDDDLVEASNNSKNMEGEETERPTITAKILREYISRARKFQPFVPASVAPYIVEAYVGLRMKDQGGTSHSGKTGDQTVMTARQLLSILRLSQALARLRFSDYVAREDVDEAIRLTHMSKASLADDDYHIPSSGQGGDNSTRGNKNEDITSRIFHILKDYTTVSRSNRLELKMCEAMALRKGFTVQQLQTCLEEYQSLDVLQMNNTGTHIHFL